MSDDPQARENLLNPRQSWGGYISQNVLWWLSFSVAIGVWWIRTDPRFTAATQWHAWQWSQYQLSPDDSLDLSQIRNMGDARELTVRNGLSLLALLMAGLSSVALLAKMFLGRRDERRLGRWFGFVFLVACWCALIANWQEYAWSGKRSRVEQLIAQLQPIVEHLQKGWPADDGNLISLTRSGSTNSWGQFMAYPVGNPRTLIMLELPQLSDEVSFAVIEGGKGEIPIRFELVGSEQGDWLEWHPASSSPQTFVSGLFEVYSLQRFSEIAPHWFLVRYHHRPAITPGRILADRLTSTQVD